VDSFHSKSTDKKQLVEKQATPSSINDEEQSNYPMGSFKHSDTFIKDIEDDLDKVYQLAEEDIPNLNYALWY
jgi:hypothetical protein